MCLCVFVLSTDDWELGHQGDSHAERLTGLEDFGLLLSPLGLSEKRMVPDPISFCEADPLGAMVNTTSNTERALVHKGTVTRCT